MTSAQFLASFARALRKARLKRGLTQEAIAEMAIVHPTYVSRVETEEYTPTIASLRSRLKSRGLVVTYGV